MPARVVVSAGDVAVRVGRVTVSAGSVEVRVPVVSAPPVVPAAGGAEQQRRQRCGAEHDDQGPGVSPGGAERCTALRVHLSDAAGRTIPIG